MKRTCLVACLAATAMLSAAGTVVAQSTGALLETLTAVEREGRGNREAQAAMKALVVRDAGILPDVLRAFDGASPLAENWLRAAFESIADRTVESGGKLPNGQLEGFLLDTTNHPRARRLAYEWLAKVDPTAGDRIIPKMLLDPSADMRRDAVARLLDEATELQEAEKNDAAIAAFRKALTGAVHDDQVQAIVKPLKELGVEVDLVEHFGFLTSWSMIGPFDNREGVGYAAVYPPEKKVDFEADYDSKYPDAENGKVAWQAVTTEDEYGLVDIAEQLVNHKGSVFYGATSFEADKPSLVQIRLGTPNAWKLWVNGKLVFAREEYHRGTKFDQYRVAVELVKGRNDILLKVCQNEQTQEWAQRYQFQVRVCDGSGSAVRPAATKTSALDRPTNSRRGVN